MGFVEMALKVCHHMDPAFAGESHQVQMLLRSLGRRLFNTERLAGFIQEKRLNDGVMGLVRCADRDDVVIAFYNPFHRFGRGRVPPFCERRCFTKVRIEYEIETNFSAGLERPGVRIHTLLPPVFRLIVTAGHLAGSYYCRRKLAIHGFDRMCGADS